MAKRMFSTQVVCTDPFRDMPSSSQALYFHLGMQADDDGFVYPKGIMRSISASEDDLTILVAKKFVIPFESGVIVIRHWHANNNFRWDRKLPTTHQQEMKKLFLDKSGMYREIDAIDAANELRKEVKKESAPLKMEKPNSIKQRLIEHCGWHHNTATFRSRIADTMQKVIFCDTMWQDPPQDRLRLAARHVAIGRCIVARQCVLIARLKENGCSTVEAMRTLALFERTLAIFKDDHQQILNEIANPGKSHTYRRYTHQLKSAEF